MPAVTLKDRAFFNIGGQEAQSFLQGLLTTDIAKLPEGEAWPGALLTPQGKILFEFFVVEAAGGYMLDVARGKAADLVKRLTMYKLRADVTVADASAVYKVLALWGKDACSSGETKDTVAFDEPRAPGLGRRILAEARFATDIASATNGVDVSEVVYHAHRITLGVPEGGKDYDFGDAYPHEANFDLFNGVSFTKGCYVGQEVVARMQNKTVVRKRVIKVKGAAPLTSGADVLLGDAVVGRIGSVDGVNALALLRVDRADEARDKAIILAAAGVAITPDQTALDRYHASAAERPAAPGIA